MKRVLELAKIVADSRYKLYDDFLHLDGRRLGEYLDAVRRATMAGLEDQTRRRHGRHDVWSWRKRFSR